MSKRFDVLPKRLFLSLCVLKGLKISIKEFSPVFHNFSLQVLRKVFNASVNAFHIHKQAIKRLQIVGENARQIARQDPFQLDLGTIFGITEFDRRLFTAVFWRSSVIDETPNVVLISASRAKVESREERIWWMDDKERRTLS